MLFFKGSISNQHNSHSVKYAVNCQQLTYINHTDETDSTPYPSNLLRNIAHYGLTLPSIEYILTLDIDIFPSPDLFHHLVSFYTKKSNKNELFNRTLYVIPAFEIHFNTIKYSIPLPQNKRELILLWNDKQIQPIQTDICPSCQLLTNYQAWKQETKNDEILPIFRPHYSQPWKPYYIGPKDIPLYDPRFKTHAHARISQV
jgi:N-acetyllactosaminide beta-1,3-N-acetylglucosaminyltransferase